MLQAAQPENQQLLRQLDPSYWSERLQLPALAWVLVLGGIAYLLIRSRR